MMWKRGWRLSPGFFFFFLVDTHTHTYIQVFGRMFWKGTSETGYWEETSGLGEQEGGKLFSLSLLYLYTMFKDSNVPP